MIYNIDTDKVITTHPYAKEFRIWRNRLSTSEFDAIVQELNLMIDQKDIHTAGWMPGKNWNGTIFEPIYTKACSRNEDESGLCFGLFVWHVFHTRSDAWYSGKFEKDGVQIKSRTYFRKRI